MKKEYKPYTYLIGWTKINKWYYGCEYSNNRSKVANPNNLWTVYFTSSKIVNHLRTKYGEPDVIEVRRTFDDKHSALKWEETVIRRMGIVESEQWLNLQNAGKNFSKRIERKPRSLSWRRKLSEAMKGRFTGKDNPFYGRKHTKKTKEKLASIRRGHTGWKHKEETRKKISQAHKGRKFTEEHIRNIALSSKDRCKGSIWITDGKTCQRIDKNAEIPPGFKRGRIINKNRNVEHISS